MDGKKIPGNASKEMSGTFEQYRYKKKLFRRQLRRLIKRHQDTDSKENQMNDSGSKHFEKQKSKLEKKINKITKFLKTNKSRIGKQKKELKSNVTDPESAKIKCGNGIIQGFNAQTVVDSKNQIIVAGKTTSYCSDSDNFKLRRPQAIIPISISLFNRPIWCFRSA
ncbi:MAG: hypothetical protein HQM08_29845 [Candidatus Riflebacteria bacterium]|nr:hypothetical protein [Candidatus Riflebacteria bacterium]